MLACAMLAGCSDQPTAVQIPREPSSPVPLYAGSALPRGKLLLDTLITVPPPETATAGFQVLLPTGRFDRSVDVVLTPQWDKEEWHAPFNDLGAIVTWEAACVGIIWSNRSAPGPGIAPRSQNTGATSRRSGTARRDATPEKPPTQAVPPQLGSRKDYVPGSCEGASAWVNYATVISANVEIRSADGTTAWEEKWIPRMSDTDRIFSLSAADAGRGMGMSYTPSIGDSNGRNLDFCGGSSCILIPAGTDWRVSVTQLRVRVYAQAPLTCNYTPTPRGSSVTCAAHGFTPGADLEWRFEEDANPANVVSETRTSGEWTGTMVASGRVSVQEKHGTWHASAHVRVQARPWQKFHVVADNQGHGGEPSGSFAQTDSPQQLSNLGHAHLPEPPATLDVEQIPDGPNKGYWYLKSFPSALPSIIHISRAWNAGHPFRQMQHAGPAVDAAGNPILASNGSQAQFCQPAQLPEMKQTTMRHEREHVRQMDRFYRDNSPHEDLERAVRHPNDLLAGATFQEYIRSEFVRRPAAAYAAGDHRYDHVTTGGQVSLAVFPCTLRFYP